MLFIQKDNKSFGRRYSLAPAVEESLDIALQRTAIEIVRVIATLYSSSTH